MKKEIDISQIQCPLPINEHDKIQLAHGSGGQLSNELISKLFVWAFDNEELNRQDDNAILNLKGTKVSFSTDSYVVDPVFFPGGNIGDLAVYGTINDVAMAGALPLYLSCGFIIEEGFPIKDLEAIVTSMKIAASNANVKIVTGDTKVVNKGKCDKIFINTSGVGLIEHIYSIGADRLTDGDIIIVSGTIGDHGTAILSQRESLSFESTIKSDTAPLHQLVQLALQAGGESIHAFRDPTRGGIAATLNEFAKSSNVGIRIKEDFIPINPAVRGASEILGLDPLFIANEGKMIVVVKKENAEQVLKALKTHPLGKEATIIGDVTSENKGMVQLLTPLGTSRIIDMPVGEQLPRIC